MYKFLIAGILLIISISVSYSQPAGFKYINIEEGLSQSSGLFLIQDSKGFLWIGTEDGLNRYDGKVFKSFFPEYKNEHSISNNSITCLYEDSDEKIWIGTNVGLNCFDPNTELFTRYFYDKNQPGSISHNSIKFITGDRNGNIWVATDYGLNKFSKNTGLFKKYFSDPKNEKSLSDNAINNLLVDYEGNLWIGTERGLDKYDAAADNFTHIFPNNTNNNLTNNRVLFICADNRKNLWIGTASGLNKYNKEDGTIAQIYFDIEKKDAPKNLINAIAYNDNILWVSTEDGLFRLNLLTGTTTSFYNSPNDPTSLSKNIIRHLLIDKSGILWVGTYGGGVNKLNPKSRRFQLYQHIPNNINSIQGNYIRSFCEDPAGNLWIGTEGAGVSVFNRNLKTYTHYLVNSANRNSIPNNRVYAMIYSTKDNVMWLGTYGGLSRFDIAKKQFTNYKNIPGDTTSLGNDRIRSLLIDKDNVLWVGTNGGGLNRFVPETQSFIRYTHKLNDPNSISSDKIFKIIEGTDGNLWIATYGGGMSMFNKKLQKFENYTNDLNNENTIRHDFIITIAEDSDGIIWLGADGAGLIKFNPATKKFTHYLQEQGLPNNTIYGILFDNHSNMWFTHNRGLSVFDPVQNTFKNYTTGDGLQGNEFNGNCCLKSASGEMFFGGINGFNSFYPDSLQNSLSIPDIVLTDFYLFNKRVKIGENDDGRIILNSSITNTKRIILNYTDKIFAFEFAALDFASTNKNQFKYKMVGLSDEWIELGTKNYVQFNSIPPGKYTFIVKCSNGDGVWSDKIKSVDIIINPPWYRTMAFYVILFISIVFIVLGYIKIRVASLKRDKERLERIVEQRTSELKQQKEEILTQNEELIHQKEEILAQRDAIHQKNKELEKLSIVASKVDNAVLIIQPDGEIEWVNDGFIRMMGVSFEKYAMEHGSNLYNNSLNDNIADVIREMVEKRKSVIYTGNTTNNQGKKIWIRTTLTPIFDENNILEKIIAIDSDITDVKLAEVEITIQRDELAQKNALIESSIKYAMTIQQIILPQEDIMNEYFDVFVIYKPKDIVSGDFYWYTIVGDHQTGLTHFFAVVDCTGHGVPGAFMSLIGNRLLNEIVYEQKVTNPAQILNCLSIEIIKALKQDVSSNRDGMDVCLCKMNQTSAGSNIVFAGAKRHLLVYRADSNEVIRIQGSRKNIGGVQSKCNTEEFKNNELFLNKNDVIYLTTDGFADQNCTDRSRFGTKRFLDIIQANGQKSLNEQKNILDNSLKEFMKNEFQRDDITVVGVKDK